MQVTTVSVEVVDGVAPWRVVIAGALDAVTAAELETAMAQVRRDPRDVVFDVANVDRLDVDGLLVLADHARWLRARSCTARLRGAPATVQQLARLLGYEHLFGLD